MPMGLVPPSSACRVVQSSGQLMNMQIGSVLVTSGLTAAQAEEIFLLSHKVQTLRGKLALISLNCLIQRQTSTWEPRPPATKILLRSVQTAPQASTVRHLSDRAKQLGCASILYSFVTLWTTKDTWYSLSTAVKRLFRLCMNAFGRWSVGLWKVQVNLRQTV